MKLPLAPPVPPQLAKSARDLPDGEGWRYEPKWDGFRT
ncbi:MAG: ATP-dependent DNA ligase, partial [Thermoleophilaceae bacterium]